MLLRRPDRNLTQPRGELRIWRQPAVPTMVDLLDPLDRWVNAGNAPAEALVQVIKAPLPPFAMQASRPMYRC